MSTTMDKKSKFLPDTLGRCDPNGLLFAPWNPESRVEATDRDFQKLVASIRIHGQLMPVLITLYGLVIDGNRRVAACQLLGIDVEYVVRANRDAYAIYKEVNDVRKNIEGKQLVEIFTKDPRALTQRQHVKISQLVRFYGDAAEILQFTRRGGSLECIRRAASLCKKMNCLNHEAVRTISEWAIKHRQVHYIKHISHDFFSRYPETTEVIWSKIRADAPLGITKIVRGYVSLENWIRKEIAK